MDKNIIVAGMDIGNGYVKGVTFCQDKAMPIDIPSGVAYVTKPNEIKTRAEEAGAVISDICNQMDASFDSVLVKDNNRRLFGLRGIMSGMALEEFDVYSHLSKAKQDLSGILILGCIAGRALQDYYDANHMLPVDLIQVHTRVSLALPIREYKKYRKEYADRLKSASHLVMIHNFEQPVRISITFDDVQVLAEGAAAQYAINAEGEPLMNAMLNDLRRMDSADASVLADITAADILAAENTVGIDIGEGTVNFPVFQNGKFDTDVSDTYDQGYGSVMNRVLDRLQDMGCPFNTRKQLVEYLQKEPSPLKRYAYNKIKNIVDEETTAFVNEINMRFVKVMSRVGAFTEVVYVYGGGATPVRDFLYSVLLETSKSFGDGEMTYPILYLDSRYSRYLNREGLFFVAKKVAGLV